MTKPIETSEVMILLAAQIEASGLLPKDFGCQSTYDFDPHEAMHNHQLIIVAPPSEPSQFILQVTKRTLSEDEAKALGKDALDSVVRFLTEREKKRQTLESIKESYRDLFRGKGQR